MLPKLAVMTFATTLESDGSRVEFRPFLVKEEKMLLTAMEGGDIQEILTAIHNLLSSCILTPGIDIDKLPPFDIEKLFLEIRKKSIGDSIDIVVKHPEPDSQCKHQHKMTVDLNSVSVHKDPNHTNKIKLTEDVGVVLRYPTRLMLEKYQQRDINSVFGLFGDCIVSVYDKDTVYDDFTKDEMQKWLGELNDAQMTKLGQFFSTMPEYRYDIEYVCKGCGNEVKIELRGLKDFFT